MPSAWGLPFQSWCRLATRRYSLVVCPERRSPWTGDTMRSLAPEKNMKLVCRRERSSPRVRRRYTVRLERNVCFTVDVSRGSCCVEVLRVVAPGTEVEGTIDVRGKAVPFGGRVLWAKAGDPYHGLRGRMGVLFTSIDVTLADLPAPGGSRAA